jgi:hypothetical protein
MRVLTGLGRGVWVGVVLIGLSVLVWFIAPQAQSCVVDFDLITCDTTWVTILNSIGLVLFVIGALSITVTAAATRDRNRRRRAAEGHDTT